MLVQHNLPTVLKQEPFFITLFMLSYVSPHYEFSRPKPVSYTHLDVYKRQELCLSTRDILVSSFRHKLISTTRYYPPSPVFINKTLDYIYESATY